MIPWWVMAVFIFGANFTLWGAIGLLRLLDGSATRWRDGRKAGRAAARAAHLRAHDIEVPTRSTRSEALTVDDVAVLIAAHNEVVVIQDSLESVVGLVPRANIHVVSDGSTDDTFELARRAGVKAIRTRQNVGKAGAIQDAIERFQLVERYQVVMLLDADTRVDEGYFDAALPLFDDPGVVAVAGRVRSDWRRRDLSLMGKLLVSHRQRIYALTQYVLKFGQTWQRTNATHIVPGFASLYRTEILPRIEVNPPGLVIEDFNMTFEVYQKGLGKVGFTPAAIAVTQDPGSLRDYVRQTKRWALGLWQTVRRHRPRPNLFTCMLILLLCEMLISSILIVLLPLVLLILLVPEVFAGALSLPGVAALHGLVAAHLSMLSLLFGVVVPDIVLTCIVALFQRQSRFLWFGGFFLILRVLDSAISLYALPLAWRSRSTGRWRSPGRRAPAAAPVTGTSRLASTSPAGKPSSDTQTG